MDSAKLADDLSQLVISGIDDKTTRDLRPNQESHAKIPWQ